VCELERVFELRSKISIRSEILILLSRRYLLASSLSVITLANSAGLRADDKKDIVDTAVAAGNFKTLAAALGAADLAGALKAPQMPLIRQVHAGLALTRRFHDGAVHVDRRTAADEKTRLYQSGYIDWGLHSVIQIARVSYSVR
jgi:hypothetical protein